MNRTNVHRGGLGLKKEIVCLKGNLLTKKEINEYSNRTGEMAALYCCFTKTKQANSNTNPVKTVRTMSMSTFPSTLPRDVIEEAKELQKHFNTLLRRVAYDHDFLHHCLKDVIASDKFLQKIWAINETARQDTREVKLGLGIFRNDFMMVPTDDVTPHEDAMKAESPGPVSSKVVTKIGQYRCKKVSRQFKPGEHLQLKQVEFNGISVGASGMLTHARDCHKYALSLAGVTFQETQLPVNEPINGIADGLIKAWELYNEPSAVILFVVKDEPLHLNPDQKWVERKIFERNSRIRVLYRSFRLLKHDIDIRKETLFVSGKEVAIVYYRTGYANSHLIDEMDYDVRLKMELSKAIQCPPVQYFLAQTKKVQQVLCEKDRLEKFVDDPKIAEQIRRTFVQKYILLNLAWDDNGAWYVPCYNAIRQGIIGDETVQMVMDSPGKFVLKNQKETGGTCIFGEDSIRLRVKELKDSQERFGYVLMEKILPVYQYNVLMTPEDDTCIRPVTNELGVYGVILGYGSHECPLKKTT